MSFKVDKDNAKAWVEDAVKKKSNNNGSVGAAFEEETMKDVHYMP